MTDGKSQKKRTTKDIATSTNSGMCSDEWWRTRGYRSDWKAPTATELASLNDVSLSIETRAQLFTHMMNSLQCWADMREALLHYVHIPILAEELSPAPCELDKKAIVDEHAVMLMLIRRGDINLNTLLWRWVGKAPIKRSFLYYLVAFCRRPINELLGADGEVLVDRWDPSTAPNDVPETSWPADLVARREGCRITHHARSLLHGILPNVLASLIADYLPLRYDSSQ